MRRRVPILTEPVIAFRILAYSLQFLKLVFSEICSEGLGEVTRSSLLVSLALETRG
jgi:hypothetical protein